MRMTMHRPRRGLAAGVVVVAIAVGTSVAGPARIAAAFGVNDHEGITFEALSERPVTFGFLRPAVFDDIVDQHDQIDSGLSGGRDERHFDDCEFDGAVEYINDRYDDALADLSSGAVWSATDEFGLALHPAQDLYAHSNWVDIVRFPVGAAVSRSDLVDVSRSTASPGLGWRAPGNGASVRGDILLGNDDWTIPRGWSIDGNGGGAHVPTLHNSDGEQVGRLLMTGEGFHDSECDVLFTPPPNLRAFDGFEHDDLNKDNESRPGYVQARSLAVLQTAYEWCRLMAKAGAVGGDGLLAALWVRTNGRPHPPGTPCAAAPPGRTEVTVVIDTVRILDSGDDGDNQPGEVQLAVALYNNPSRFTRSVHATNRNGRINVRDGESVPTGRLPAPLTLFVSCADLEEQVTLAVHGWDNDDSSGDLFANDFDDKDDDDEVLIGFQRRVGPRLPSGPQRAQSKDLEVTYHFVLAGEQCGPAEEDFRTVPAVTFLSPSEAAQDVRGAGLEPRFTGETGVGDTFVEHQQPAPGRRVAAGSTVTMKLRKGQIR